jgi:hypothetical protein
LKVVVVVVVVVAEQVPPLSMMIIKGATSSYSDAFAQTSDWLVGNYLDSMRSKQLFGD